MGNKILILWTVVKFKASTNWAKAPGELTSQLIPHWIIWGQACMKQLPVNKSYEFTIRYNCYILKCVILILRFYLGKGWEHEVKLEWLIKLKTTDNSKLSDKGLLVCMFVEYVHQHILVIVIEHLLKDEKGSTLLEM